MQKITTLKLYQTGSLIVVMFKKEHRLNKITCLLYTSSEEQSRAAAKEYRNIVEKAKIDAGKTRDSIIEKANEEAKEKLDRVSKEIEAEKLAAKAEVKSEIVNIAIDVASKIMNQEMDQKANEKLVDEFIKEIDK